jgi:PEGA domain
MRLYAIACTLLAAASAHAAPRGYALRELRVAGDMPEAERQRLKEQTYAAVEMLISGGGGELARAEDVDRVLAERPRLKNCYDWRCHVELGDALKSNRVLIIRIERAGPPGSPGKWTVKAISFAVDAIRLVGTQETTCDACVAEDLIKRDTIIKAITPLIGKNDPTFAVCHLKVDSAPSEARISLDETELGATPFDRTISPGKHTVTVELQGYAPSKLVTDCPKAGDRSLRVELSQSTAPPPPGGNGNPPPVVPSSADRRPLFRGLGFASVGLAVAGVVGLGVAGYYQGRPNCDTSRCTYLYNETPALAISAVGVVAFATVAGVLLWKGYQQPPGKRSTWIAPAVAGGAVSVQLGGNF